MKKFAGRATMCVCFLFYGNTAWAQFGEFWFSAGQHLLSSRDLGTDVSFGGSKSDYQLTDGFRWGLRAVFNTPGRTGFEVGYGYNRTQLKYNPAGSAQGMAGHNVAFNYVYYLTTEGARVRPFGTGGVGFTNWVPPGSSAARGQGSTKYGFNYGGGIKVRVTGMWAVRFDVRQYASPKPFNLLLKEGWLRQTEVSAGIGIVF